MSAKAKISQKGKSGTKNFDSFQKRVGAAKRRGGYRVKVGLPKGSGNYPETGTPIILVGAVHEFGSDDGRIPERSWLRSAMRDSRKEIRDFAEDLARSVTQQKRRSPEDALALLGTKAVSIIQEQITALSSPPNTAETIRRKGSSNPLIDNRVLVQAISYQVIGKSK